MAKPAKIKKKQAASSRKGRKKAAEKVERGREMAAREKAGRKDTGRKETRKKGGGFKGRVAKAQAAKAAKPDKSGRGSRIVKFLREVKGELAKVTWPSREELVQSTIVVLIAVVVAGVYISLFDLLFSRLIGVLGPG